MRVTLFLRNFEHLAFACTDISKIAGHVSNAILIAGSIIIVKLVVVVDEPKSTHRAIFVLTLNPRIRILYICIQRWKEFK
ncbi:hypothetical protein CF68_23460 [Cupriavidus sp. SK-4]|nr:hypothetical protein CF68_23460 [Cupriavidus sp. SK-4]